MLHGLHDIYVHIYKGRACYLTLGSYFAVILYVSLNSNNCHISDSDAVACGQGRCFKMQWLQIGIFTDRAMRQRQHTLEEGLVCNVWGSVHKECTVWGSVLQGCKFFHLIIKFDQLEMTESHMFLRV